MNFFEVLFGNLFTLTIALTACAIMIAIAVRAVRNITHQEEARKKKTPPKDL